MSTSYHRLARETPVHRWWRLPLAGILGLAGYFAAGVGLLAAAAFVIYASGRDVETVIDRWSESPELDLTAPGLFAVSMISIAILLPVVLIAVQITGPRPIGFLTSVEGRMRWRWLGRVAAVAFAVYGVALGVSLAVTAATSPGQVSAPQIDGTAVLVLALILLLTPFQAAAEEYVFRGYVLQLVGSWTRFAAIPVIVSVPLFAVGHTYGLWGLVDVGVFGLTAAYLTIRTGGLEAAIAAHIANNVVLMVVEALGIVGFSDNGGPLELIPTVVTSITMVLYVSRLADRLGIARTRAPIEPLPPPRGVWPRPQALSGGLVAQWPPPVVRAEPTLHPDTPDYPGELPPGWKP
ncbi:hypothetical protein C6I20_15170 [Aeromicrobium sp. A1-2]|uniref:CPBP family intramembrane glutamic endopeptidase n=1 Tax=Aeromicrobium sp. A1-2 TaxID=2107713 RepID=UPI000E54B236|nr:CPBP family intramembrane glutamic endopeptidase [Aeromicrobium sp. A1-2]AXT86383.1 hypothetical protein C6I20_15170 [Aeromicrobium sp. A1-2]